MDSLISRNNTSFIKNVTEAIKKISIDKSDPLKYHQRIIHEYVLNYPLIRGILVYWEMGAGKTILSASLAESLIPKFKRILFISSKTLHKNFMNDYKKYLTLIQSPVAESDETMENHISKHCKFITLTANNMLQQVYKAINADEIFTKQLESILDVNNQESDNNESVKKFRDEIKKMSMIGNLNDSFIIIDEAHNFFNGITNGSKNYVGLYQLIMDATKIKVIFLTGSPIVNDPFEIALCFNMLQGYFKTTESRTALTLFGEDYNDFNKYFVTVPTYLTEEKVTIKTLPSIKHKDKFSDRITGLVSYYGTNQEEIQKLFPELKELKVLRIPMSIPQYVAYSEARDKEQEENKRLRPSRSSLSKPQGLSSSYRVRSRQISNFLYPPYASKSYKDERNFVRYERYIDKLKPECFEISPNGLETWSPKLLKLMYNLSAHLPEQCLTEFKQKETFGIGPGIVYSQFIDSGIGLVAKILKQYGMQEITSDNIPESPKGTFAIISGEVSPEFRAEIVKLAMSPDNKQGKLLTLLLITATGSEGVNTKYMRHIHALEPFWHWSRLAQVFARAVRINSHTDLPKSEQNVQPYLYLSDYPTALNNKAFKNKKEDKSLILQSIVETKKAEETTDVTLYYRALQNQILINSFQKVLKEGSIDCLIHYNNSEIACRACQPTNETLFIPDLDKDIMSSSKCRQLKEEKIIAESITVEDEKGKREYMFTKDKDKVPHFFVFQPNINAYQEIFEDSPDYFALYSSVNR